MKSQVCNRCGKESSDRAPEVGRQPRRSSFHAALEEMIVIMLAERAPWATLSMPEVAELRFGPAYRRYLGHVRRAARELRARGLVELVHTGTAVDPGAAAGPVRIARGPAFHAPLAA